MKLFLSLLLFLCVQNFVRAQDSSPTALQRFSEWKSTYMHAKYTQAYTLAQAALQNIEKSDSVYVFMLNAMALTQNQLQRKDSAVYYFNLAQQVCDTLLGTQHPYYARIVCNHSRIYLYNETHERDSAIAILDSALVVADSSTAITLYREKLTTFNGRARYEEAEQAAFAALNLCKQLYGEQNARYINLLELIATVYSDMGRYEEAEGLFLKMVDLAKAVYGEANAAQHTSYSNFANLYSRMGRYEEAEAMQVQELNRAEAQTPEASFYKAIVLNNLAEIYQLTNRLQEAEGLYIRAEKMYKLTVGEQHPYYAASLGALATVYSSQKKYKEAEDILQKSLSVLQKTVGEQHFFYMESLHNLAQLYSQNQRHQEAKALYHKNLSLIQQSYGEHYPIALQAWLNLAQLYHDTRQMDSAHYCYQQVILVNTKDIADSTLSDLTFLNDADFHANDYIVPALSGIYRVYSSKLPPFDNPLKAHQALKTALQVAENMRNRFVGEKDKLRILADADNLIAEMLDKGQELNPETTPAALFRYAELNKSALLADALKGNRARNLGDLPDSLALKELRLQNRYDDIKKQMAQAKTPEAKALAAEAAAQLNIEIDAFRKSIEDKYPKYHKLKHQDLIPDVSEIQARLPDSTLLLEYVVTDKKIYLFAIDQQTVQLHKIHVERPLLQEKVAALRNALTNYKAITENPQENFEQFTATAFWFYQNLLQVALQGSSAKRLFLVTDGELGHLPFEVFLTAPVTEQQNFQNLPYLLQRYTLSYNYSATIWRENRDMALGHNNGKILVFGADYSFKKAPEGSRLPHITKLRHDLQPLPAVRDEMTAFRQLFAKDTLVVFDSIFANESQFKRQAADYSVIHLAMHGILNRRHPILSSLAFTEDGDSTEDNFLEAWEIARMSLNADLVVLSACETGYGKFEQGEGVLSLARSFMYAGAPALVVSLWEVNDRATAQIMQLFYKNLTKQLPKDEALQQAKRGYLANAKGIAAHPAYWSAFVQMGDHRAVPVGTNRIQAARFWWVVFGSGSVFSLLLAIGFFRLFLQRDPLPQHRPYPHIEQ